MIPIYSKKMKNEMESEGIGGIQYLSVEIIGFNGESFGFFYIANIVNFFEAFDYKKSVFSIFSDDFPNPNVRGKIAGVKKFALRNNNLFNCDIFRLVEYNQRFFITEKIKNLFNKRGYTGYSFIEIEDRL